MRLGFLLAFYQEVLDEHPRRIMKSYYEDDLSLAEIAEGVGISRQGVRHIIKRAEDRLLFLEEKLHLAERFSRLDKIKSEISDIAAELKARTDCADLAERLLALSDEVSEGE